MRMLVGTKPKAETKDLEPAVLSDGRQDSCTEAGNGNSQIEVTLPDCENITSVNVSVQGNYSSSVDVSIQGCDESEVNCSATAGLGEDALERSYKYSCPVVSSFVNHVVVVLPAGITVCELDIYKSGPKSSAPSIVLSPFIVVPDNNAIATTMLPGTRNSIKNCTSIVVQPESTVLVKCSATGYPVPEYDWQSRNSSVSNTGRRKVTSDGSLKLKRLSLSKNGGEWYECRAINSEGEDRKCIHVKVVDFRPKNVHVIDITDNSAVVTWDQGAPNHVHRIRILLRNKEHAGSRETIIMEPINGRKWQKTLNGLTELTCYDIQIQAFTSEGEVPRVSSSSQTFITSGSLVQKLRASMTSRSAVISWEIARDLCHEISKYDIHYRKLDGSQAMSINSHAVDRQSVSLSGLTPNTEYTVEVVATVMSVRMKKASLTFTTMLEASSPPRNVSYHSVTAYSVVIHWLKPLNVYGTIAKYNVSLFMSNVKGRSWHIRVGGQHHSVHLRGLSPYRKYSLWVQAGTGTTSKSPEESLLWSEPNSEIVKFTTLQHKPSKPRNVIAPTEGVMARSFQLHWEEPSLPNGKIQFYLIEVLARERGPGKSRWNVSHSISSVNSRKEMYANISGLSPYTSYRVTVTAVNVENGTKLIGVKTMIPVKTTDEVPVSPSNCHITHKSSKDIFVRWHPPLPNDYNIVFYYVTYTPLREKQGDSRQVSSESVQLGSLLPYTEYHITIAAVTNNTKLLFGEPCKITERTMIGALPVPDGPKQDTVPSTELSSITIALPIVNTTDIPIHTEVVIFELQPGVYWSENMTFPNPGDSRVLPSYSVKRLPPNHGGQIVIGTEQNNDIQVQSDKRYALFIRWVAEEDNGTELNSISLTNVHFSIPANQPSSSDSGIAVWIFAVIAAIVILAIMAVIILFIRLRHMRAPSKTETKNEIPEDFDRDSSVEVKKVRVKIMDESKEPVSAYSVCVIDDKPTATTTSVIDDFEQHFEQLSEDDNKGFAAEFEDLASIGKDQSSAYARQRDQAKRNRYQNIVPYDNNRVALEELEGMSILENDYINASYLDGFSKGNAYLVTQGPLPTTCCDFWRMIWLNKPSAIVMLTRTVENSKHKCKQYWSDREPLLYDGLSVVVESFVEFADYTIRSMKLELLEEEYIVKHYHFKSWPDHGVPTYATDLLGLIYRVRRETVESSGPLVVHCSAGVGRSGTYITVDMLLDCLKSEVETINVREIVAGMRMKRMEMVQSVPQYILIHEAVLEAFYTQKAEIKGSRFSEEFAKLQSEQPTGRKIDEEFQTLLDLSPPPDESAFGTARLPTVLGRKNRSSKFVAPDTVRVMLHIDDDSPDANYANTRAGADYINASFINSYFATGAFIVTQAPLSSTKADLWKMVYEQNATAIINLAQPHEQEIYWPESGSQSYGQFTIELLSSETRNAFTLYKLWLSKKHTDIHIALFHYNAWPEDGPPSDFAGLLEMTSQFDQWKKQSGGHCSVVHCCTGMGRSGIFCAAYNALDQLQNEGVVNILQTAKVLRNQRPGIIQTPEHYETVYRIVNQHLRSSSVYANVK
jgi:protein tyrosine phosphatase